MFTPSAVEREDGSLVLVDTALPEQLDGLAAALADHNFALDTVSTVVLTHHDADHAGALATLLNKTSATVLTHRDEAPYSEDEAFPTKPPEENKRYPPPGIDVGGVGNVVIRTAAGPLMEQAMKSTGKLAALDVEGVLAFHGGHVETYEDGIAALT